MPDINDPIRPQGPRYDGRYYANINGITRSSIGCYFDINGALTATTLEKNHKYDDLFAKLENEISRRGVVMPEAGEILD
jgi:hypothetical protein